MENERRFLLDRLPPGDWVDYTTIRQAYWQLGDGWSLRVRREGKSDDDTRNSITIKGPRNGLGRPELNLFLPDDAESVDCAERLFRAAGDHKIVKTRYSYLLDGHTWDVDHFHWENDGLIVAEIELEDPAELALVRPPSWAKREITHEAQYTNDQLAVNPFRGW